MGLVSKFISGMADTKAIRRPENLFTGARLTPTAHALGSIAGAGSIGYSMLKNEAGIRPSFSKEVPGISQAPAMSYDFKRNPTMGSSGALTLALSDMQGPPGKY